MKKALKAAIVSDKSPVKKSYAFLDTPCSTIIAKHSSKRKKKNEFSVTLALEEYCPLQIFLQKSKLKNIVLACKRFMKNSDDPLKQLGQSFQRKLSGSAPQLSKLPRNLVQKRQCSSTLRERLHCYSAFREYDTVLEQPSASR